MKIPQQQDHQYLQQNLKIYNIIFNTQVHFYLKINKSQKHNKSTWYPRAFVYVPDWCHFCPWVWGFFLHTSSEYRPARHPSWWWCTPGIGCRLEEGVKLKARQSRPGHLLLNKQKPILATNLWQIQWKFRNQRLLTTVNMQNARIYNLKSFSR